jgi:xanthine dehydrogenase accessory factor
VGEGGLGPVGREGVLEYTMTCHSGGSLEIFIEPVLPKPELLLVGRGPVVETLMKLGEAMDFAVTLVSSEVSAIHLPQRGITPRTYIVVVTHGTSDEDALEQALRTGAGYVSLVASPKRAGAVIGALRARGVPAEQLSRLRAPAGLDIGAVTPREIAVSIVAEIVQMSRSQTSEWKSADAPLKELDETQAKDPVCGMSVEITSAQYRSEAAGRTFYFCCARCKQMFDQSPARFVESVSG